MKRNVLLGKKNAGHVINYLIIKENTAQHIHRLKPSLKNKKIKIKKQQQQLRCFPKIKKTL